MSTTTLTDTLATATDEELNVICATEVAQWTNLVFRGITQPQQFDMIGNHPSLNEGWTGTVPIYVHDANAALELLAKHDWNAWTQGEGNTKRVYVSIYPARGEKGYTLSCAPTFEKAVVLALIRHVRAGKVGKVK